MAWGLFSKTRSGHRTRPTPPIEWPPALRSALSDLERLLAARPELEPAGRTLARALEAAFATPARPLMPVLDPDSAEGKLLIQTIEDAWQAGEHAFERVAHLIDGPDLADRALSICAAVGTDGSPAAGRLHDFIKHHPQRVLEWAKASLVLAGDSLDQSVLACDSGLDPAQVAAVLKLVMLPALAGWSRQVCARLTEGTWPHGLCPVCGASPALAESRGLEQRRHLRCDRCAADWPCQHFLCPYCGTSDHRSLRYVFIDGEQDRARLGICDACGGRLKVIATIGPLSAPGLLVAELASIHLDLIDDSPETSSA